MYFELAQGAVDASPRTIADRFVATRATCAGAWAVTAGASLPAVAVLHRWDNLAAREAALAGGTHVLACGVLQRHATAVFGPSPAWKTARRELPLPSDAIYELRLQRVLNGHGAEAAQVLGESTLPLLQAMGAHVVGVLDLLLGANRPRLAILLAWPGLAAQQQAWERLHVEPRFWRRRDEEQARLHRRLFGDEETLLLAALPGLAPEANLGVAP
jgi:hypothetical protein